MQGLLAEVQTVLKEHTPAGKTLQNESHWEAVITPGAEERAKSVERDNGQQLSKTMM